MRNRLGLDKVLRDVLSDLGYNLDTGEACVYFQPPESIKMRYPCIVYERNSGSNRFADNAPYISVWGYTVTVIDKNPDSKIPEKIAELPMCRIGRHFVADNLNHDVFELYY